MRRPAANGQTFRIDAIWGAKLGVVMTFTALLVGGCADIAVFHAPAQFVGLATTPKEGRDFVKETHPDKTEFTSVGVEPGHQDEKARDAAGVKQLQAELEAQRATGHAIIQTLTPPPATPVVVPTPQEKAKAKADAKALADAKKKPKSKDQTQGDAQQPQ